MGFSSTSPLPLIDAKAARGLILAAFPRRLRFCLDIALRIDAAGRQPVAQLVVVGGEGVHYTKHQPALPARPPQGDHRAQCMTSRVRIACLDLWRSCAHRLPER